MRHRKDGRQFGRNTSHRRAMFRNLAANLVTHERIVTTDVKAKELRRVAERLISKAKRLGPVASTPHAELGGADRARRLHVARLLGAYLPRWGVERDGTKRDLVDKVMVELSRRFANRPGGYTRITKLGPRRGDGASLCLVELVDAPPFAAEAAAPEAPGDAAATAAPEPGGAEATTAPAASAEPAGEAPAEKSE